MTRTELIAKGTGRTPDAVEALTGVPTGVMDSAKPDQSSNVVAGGWFAFRTCSRAFREATIFPKEVGNV